MNQTFGSEIFLKIFNEISEGFLITDGKGEVLFFNEILPDLLELSTGELLSRQKELLGLLGEPDESKTVQRLIASGSGEIAPFNISSFSLPRKDGEKYFLMKVERVSSGSLTSPFIREFPRLLKSLSDAVCAVSLDGKIIQANIAFYRLLEFEENERHLENIRDLYVYPEDLDEKIDLLNKQGYVSSMENLLITRTGKTRQFGDTSWVIKDETGNITGYICLFRDLSRLRNLESRLLIAEKNHGQLFDSILVSIILVDPAGRVLNLNSAARNMYGFTWNDVAGESYDELFSTTEDSPLIMEVMEKLKEKDILVVEEVERRRKDGTAFTTQTFFKKVYDISEEVVAYTVMEKDLTERIRLENELKESLDEIKKTQSAAILGFAKLTEYRDGGTGKHLERIREYTRVMAKSLQETPEYRGYIDDEYIENLCLSSSLHDVGKVGIEDKILLKPGKLDDYEYEEIKKHTKLGGKALGELDDELDKRSFLSMGKEIAYYHHERWDGKGYPEGKSEENIPLSARIVAIADVYDALTSERSYKKAMSHEEAFDIIRKEKGKQFDPGLVDVFVENHKSFKQIKRQIYADDENKKNVKAKF